ncbi:hypothetical protein ASG52_12050 [Methylobacterium sp. Leaf456]|uniref:hypothetical protein n=1 Tax=Methylobacterium sp. Leaf456 TaxID=1736382 RepID=UPI0006FE24EE|nr:hypothetical protein [Methylobacterium sp. Leaf456]KQT46463.1 hypothetical protein ASG52_12050 [Methylobacterium sp. Leaf456]
MRVPALAVLIALAPSLAAADDAFRARLSDAITQQGGCAESRALVEGELAAFERARKGDGTGDEAAPLLLFGKPAVEWSGEDIGDLVAVIRDCEAARPGQSRNTAERERRLTERMDRLAQAMQRAVVLGARPPEVEETAAHPALRAGALSAAEAGGGGSEAARRTGRRGPGPAFVPLDSARAAAPAVPAPARAAAHAPAAASSPAPPPEFKSEPAPVAAAAPRREAPRVAFAPGAALGTEPAFRQSAIQDAADEPAPACLVTRDRFERVAAGMSLTEVEGLFGCRGRLDSAAVIDGTGTFEVYVWSPPGGSGSVTVTFQNRRLKTKALRGMG